jgi:hypothetical protein
LAFERKRLAGALEGLMSLDEVKSIDCLFANDEGLHQITTEVAATPKEAATASILKEHQCCLLGPASVEV